VLALRAHLPVMVLRPSAIYGPYDTDFLQLFRAVARGWLPCIGRQELHIDVCFVDDLVRGMLAVAESPHGAGEVYCFGGSWHTWREMGETIAAHAGTRLRELRLPRPLVLATASAADGWARLVGRPSILSRANLVERLQPFWLFDSSKARETFGYVPQVSLAQGVAKTLQWYHDLGWL
jgi:nucleoside-diphosphate-sugar epimerase